MVNVGKYSIHGASGQYLHVFLANGNIRTQRHGARGAQPLAKNRRNGPCHDPFRCHMLPGDGENEAATFKELMGFFWG